MNKFFLLITVLLVSNSVLCQNNTRVHLKTGVNTIDLNNDGTADTVFMATYDNNTSHPSETLTVFVKTGKSWFIVPVPDDEGFILADFRLSGSALKVNGVELHQLNGIVYLIRGVKYAANGDITDGSKVKFSRYSLAANNDDPGTSAFYWEAAGSYLTEQIFNSVDDAFQTLAMEKFR
ncbi:carbapenem self-resistance protein CarG family protein [Pseudescherichia vulneris]|uniref:carbapenem self-resistance protein CarG family protein n=1 Tax=Pseudescherichia vulneris TaxID=566 RepID=UPI000697CA74|nr:hypothetical protein [Pseudescherichia vulneris]STQ59863.1 Uncharacterised protein [Pseudescherichia vulneris]